MSQATYGQPSYGMTRRLVGLSFEEGVARAREQFAKLMKFKPGAEGFSALQDWRDRVAERPSAQA